jgi:hypothetical protein
VSPIRRERPPTADCLVTGGPGNAFTLLPRSVGEHGSDGQRDASTIDASDVPDGLVEESPVGVPRYVAAQT